MVYLDNEVLDELLEILGTDDLCAITASFAAQLDQQLLDLTTHSSRAEFAETARIAHSLKGGAGNLGAHVLSSVAATLERAARDANAEQVATAMKELPTIATNTITALRAQGYLPIHSC